MTEEQVRQRIHTYRTRYGVDDLNEEGFPVFPTGLRETKQHREWITLYKLFGRSRKRTLPAGESPPSTGGAACPVCLQPGGLTEATHRECVAAVELVRKLGLPALDRIRAEALPDDAGAARPVRTRSKGKT